MAGTVTTFLKPRTLEQALALLAERPGEVAPVAGSTAIGQMAGLHKPILMDLGGLGLAGVTRAGSAWRVGAMTRIAEMERDPGLGKAFQGLLARATRRLASEPLRHMITVGGNAFQVFAWSELPPLLLALGARFVLTRRGGERILTCDELYARNPRHVLESGELLTAVELDPLGPGDAAAFERFSLAENDYSAAHFCAVRRGREVRLALGGLYPLPRRVPQVEELLSRAAPADWEKRKVRAVLLDAMSDPIPNVHFSAEYRKNVCADLVVQALPELAGGGAA
jgi:CO/xanthine dehydrogenase FAD-binding subunit